MGDVGFASWEELNIVKAPGMNFGWPIYEGNEYTIPLDDGPTYNDLNVENRDEPNPLYGVNGCTQQYLYFRQMIRPANVAGDKTIYNPCDPSQPIGNGYRYYHNRPALEWSHAHPWARVGIFDENNNPSVALIGSPESNVVGSPFPGSCSVGGAWYMGDSYPAEYKNSYFQADFVGPLTGPGGPWLRRVSIDFTDVVTRVDNFATGFTDLVCITTNPIDGSLVTVQMVETGAGIKQIVYGGNQPPVAMPKANKIFGASPLTVNFTGTDSYDPTPGGNIVSYSWDFGGGVPATSNVANPGNIVFTDASGNPRKFDVTLTVTDNGGATHTESMVISVNNTPPVVTITSPVKNSFYSPGPDSVYACTATVTDNEHGAGQLTYEWQTTLRHNTHEHREAIKNEVNSSTLIQRVGFYGTDTYYWLIELTVTDAAGLSTKDSAKIFPNVGVVTGTLSGSVSLQGRPAAPNSRWQTPLKVDFFLDGNMATPAFSRNVTTDNSGNFTISNITPGNYKIAVKNIHTLQKVSQLTTIGAANTTINFGSLEEGDVNDNNVVNLFDFSLLLGTYNKASGNPGYDSRADFNGDGVVNLFDFSLLLGSYNKTGQAP
jgi:PKD repeat protein